MPNLLESLRTDVRARDEAEFALGDTLDVKASILLVVVIFLAGITGSFLNAGGRGGPIKWSPFVCAGFLLISGILIVCVIWPRTYLMEGENRASELLNYFEEDPSAEANPSIERTVLKDDISETVNRIKHNHAINAKKAQALRWAFYTVIPALVLEFLNAAIILISRPS